MRWRGKGGKQTRQPKEPKEPKEGKNPKEKDPKAQRGHYRCSKCRALKTNHDCPIVEQYTADFSVQVVPVVLTPEEFEALFVAPGPGTSAGAPNDLAPAAPCSPPHRLLVCRTRALAHAAAVAEGIPVTAPGEGEGTGDP